MEVTGTRFRTPTRIMYALAFLGGFMLLWEPKPGNAQIVEPPIKLGIHRSFGYSMGGKIQGAFALKVSAPIELTYLEFKIDEQVVCTAVVIPATCKFNTDNFSLGVHTITAVGRIDDGNRLDSNVFTVEFVSSDQGPGDVLQILGGIFGLLAVVGLVSFLIPSIRRKQIPHTREAIGIAGGAVCRRCRLPFPRSFFSPNLVFGKLARCPHCRSWGIYPRASLRELDQAFDRLSAQDKIQIEPNETQAQKYQTLIDDSRFEE